MQKTIDASTRHLQKITGASYQTCQRFVEDNSTASHIHLFDIYGDPIVSDTCTTYRLRCGYCGGNTFYLTV